MSYPQYPQPLLLLRIIILYFQCIRTLQKGLYAMILTFNKEQLLTALNTVSKAVPTKTTSTILECILFDATTGEIKLTGNDMELGIETKVEGNIIEPGKIALEAKLICDIIRKLEGGGEHVYIETITQGLTKIRCGKTVFQIQGLDGEEFSYLPYIEKDHFITLSQFTLKEVIRQTLFSAAVNNSNKMMCGELIEVHENIAKFVTLDGHRISIRNILLRENYDDMKVIVPGKTLNEISRIISGDNEKEIRIYFSTNHILFEFDNTIVVSRLIEGQYFKIEHMLSSDYELKINVNKNKFLSTIDSATILIKENDHKPIILDIKDGVVKTTVKSSAGSMDDEIEAIKTGKDLMIAFNPKFLIDALKVIDDEYIDIYMTNSKAPCFIRDSDGNSTYLLLPVNFVV